MYKSVKHTTMNNTERLVFSGLILFFIVLFSASGYFIKDIGNDITRLEVENSELRVKVDSLLIQCEMKDSAFSNAAGIALDLSERINLLYYKDKEAHAKMFE